MAYDQQPCYIDNLLAVRGLSSIGVVLSHCLNHSSYALGVLLLTTGLDGSLYDFLRMFWPVTGRNFVMFFFVHSGYLMGKVFYEGRYEFTRPALWRFYRGRLLRIVPLLYVSLVFYAAFHVTANPHPLMLLGDIFFFNNLTDRGLNPVTWSLSWEMQYYLLAPFVYFLFSASGRYRTMGLFAAIALFAWIAIKFELFAMQYLTLFLAGYSVNIALRRSSMVKFRFSNSLGILLGFFGGNAMFYLCWNARQEALAFLLLMLLAWITIFFLELPYSRQPGEKTRAFYEEYGHLRILFLRGLTWLGVLSYGIYLWHIAILSAKQHGILAVLTALNNAGMLHTPAQQAYAFHLIQLPVVLGLTILVSLLTFFLIELRFRPHLYNIADSRYFTFRIARWLTPQ